MSIFLFSTIVAGYVFWRAIWPLQTSWNIKGPLICLLILAAYKFKILHLFGGPMYFSPDLPWWVLLPGAWLFSVVFIYFFLLLLTHVGQGLWALIRLCLRKGKAPAQAAVNKLNLALLCLSVVLASVGIVAGTAAPQVKEVTIYSERLPRNADGLRIALMADIHVDRLTHSARVKEMVRRVNELNPDVVLIAGDFVDGRVSVYAEDLRPLQGLKAKYGVFGVPGNHEYYSGYTEWMRFLPTLGIRMLENEHTTIADGTVTVAGVTDPAAHIRSGLAVPDVAQALSGAPQSTYRVLLAHQPRMANEAVKQGVDLQLSGHTHGGMILGFSRIVAMFNGGYVSGMYELPGGMNLYVSNGTGIWNGFPVRIGVPAEITLITLKKGKDAEKTEDK